MSVIPAVKRLRQEDCEFKAISSYIVRLVKNPKKLDASGSHL
jgi:hypothetical protein